MALEHFPFNLSPKVNALESAEGAHKHQRRLSKSNKLEHFPFNLSPKVNALESAEGAHKHQRRLSKSNKLEHFPFNLSPKVNALESAEGAHKHQRRLSKSNKLEHSDQMPNVTEQTRNALDNGLFIANVVHKRLAPRPYQLAHQVYYICVPIRHMEAMRCSLFSINRFNLLSFHDRDYGFGGRLPGEWITEVLQQWNLKEADGAVMLLTMPRVLGYGFNPVSFWFCFDSKAGLRAVIAEVNNTFGERHAYVCCHTDHRPITEDDWLEANKIFHVSPFFDVEGHYRFRFAYRPNAIGVWIDYHDRQGKVLMTSLTATGQPLTNYHILTSFFRYPLVTLKVIVLIHYHALRLVMKGMRYRKKPHPPQEETSQ